MNLEHLDAAIDAHEGFRYAPYKDSRGRWTFGKGACLETNPPTGADWKLMLDNGWLSVSISVRGADYLRDQKLIKVEGELEQTFSWWGSLNDARQNALIEMGYQMGVERLLGFGQMLAAIHLGDWDEVYKQALDSDWARETPARAQVLAKQLQMGQFA